MKFYEWRRSRLAIRNADDVPRTVNRVIVEAETFPDAEDRFGDIFRVPYLGSDEPEEQEMCNWVYEGEYDTAFDDDEVSLINSGKEPNTVLIFHHAPPKQYIPCHVFFHNISYYPKSLQNRSSASSMKFVNLTPHDVTVFTVDGEKRTYPRSGTVARVEENAVPAVVIDGVQLYSVTYGAVAWLPSCSPGYCYIVSAMVASAAPDRGDLVVPYGVVRDDEGRIIGCKGFR